MIVGLLSDTHGRGNMAAAAVRLLLDRGVEHLVHCGDVGDGDRAGLDVIDALAGGVPATFVYGNNDDARDTLARYAAAVDVTCAGDDGRLVLGDKVAVVTHGDDGRLVRAVLAEQAVDYLFVGHTHQRLDRREGRVRIVNPGALHRARTKSVAVLDTAADTVEFLTVDG